MGYTGAALEIFPTLSADVLALPDTHVLPLFYALLFIFALFDRVRRVSECVCRLTAVRSTTITTTEGPSSSSSTSSFTLHTHTVFGNKSQESAFYVGLCAKVWKVKENTVPIKIDSLCFASKGPKLTLLLRPTKSVETFNFLFFGRHFFCPWNAVRSICINCVSRIFYISEYYTFLEDSLDHDRFFNCLYLLWEKSY